MLHGKNNETLKNLAIFGGTKVRTEQLPFRKAFGDCEIEMLMEAVNYYSSRDLDPPYEGRYEKQYCKEFAEMMGGGYADAVATGTGAVFVALEALGPEQGSEVIISPFVDAGPFNCIVYKGCVPVISDTAPGSYNINLESIISKVSEKTKVLLIVHSAGEPIDIAEIVEEMHSRNIKVLEDCSQAPGAICKGKRVGTFGDIAAISTMYRKTLSAGASSGIVYTQDEDLYKRALACADRGKPVWDPDYDFRSPGMHLFPALNWNTDELSCAIGIASLRRLDDVIQKRISFFSKLKEALARLSKACQAYDFPEGSSPFFIPIWVDTEKLTCTKFEFASAVQAEGVDLNPHYDFLVSDWSWAIPYAKHSVATPNAKSTKNQSFNLFLNENYGQKEVDDITNAILKVEEAYILPPV